jgi:hypothetical protein
MVVTDLVELSAGMVASVENVDEAASFVTGRLPNDYLDV